MIIRGVAGTGKTTLEQEIGEALAEAGRPVVALAQSVKASREVLREKAGFAKADTVAMFLKDEEMQESARDGVILVDEASQLGTRDMLQVFDVAEAVGARVVLVGDRRQHRSVTAGEPLKLLEEKAGLRVAEVTEILRQQGDYKKAAEALSEGRTEEGFKELDKLGWIKQVADDDRYKQLAAAYLSAVAEKKRDGQPKSALVVSPTHAEGNRITEAIRDGLKAQGQAWQGTHRQGMGSGSPDGCRESGPDAIRAGRPAPVPPECARLQERIAADRGRGGRAADGACESVRGCTGRRSSPWRSATACGSRPAARPRTASTAQQRVAADRPGIHQAGRHHRRSRLGHRPGFRPLDPRLCPDQPCQPGRYGG